MFLKRIDISRFRGIRQLSLQLDQTTVLIGENNTGKSTILDALRLALGGASPLDRIKFSEYDHHLTESVGRAADHDTIEIVLHFAEQSDGEWSAEIAQRLSEVIQYDDGGRQSVILRVRSRYDASTNESTPEWDFLDLKMQRLPVKALQYRRSLQLFVPIYYLKSIRDTDREFRPSSPLWRPFVRAMNMAPNVRQGLEDELVDLNQRIIDAHEPFSVIKDYLGNISKMVPLTDTDAVSIEALTGSILDTLSQTKVSLTSITGAKIPVGRHGEGTRSLAIICLLVASLHSNLSKVESPILTLEEPEAHLHPSAAYSVTELLKNSSGQNIIATHSGDLVSNVDMFSLRRLSRNGGVVTVSQIDQRQFRRKDMLTIDHHIRITRGNMLFARCWLLVEGKTERLVFEQCARICRMDLTREGVYCIDYTQIGSPRTLIKFAKQMGIEWFIVADGDDAGRSYVKKAEKEICNEDADAHICQLDHIFDVLLCTEGYGHHYERAARIDSANQPPAKDAVYWNGVVGKMNSRLKTHTATLAIDEMRGASGLGVPEQIRQIIIKSIHLAKGGQ